MYLLYDVIRLRRASLGYGILAKRRDWKKFQNALNSLTIERLQQAIDTVKNHRPIVDTTINPLLRHLRSVGAYEPYSFTHKNTMRAEMKGETLRLGMTAWWLTVNPSDQRNPLVLDLAGVKISHEAMPKLSTTIRRLAATSNPAAVAEFFHHICNALFDDLLRSGTNELGILGKVSGHYGVVETNGRGMFHIHSLVWLAGNFVFEELRSRVLNDPGFADRLISFLESALTTAIDNALADDESLLFQSPTHLSTDRSDEDFYHDLLIDSETVASKTQIHSSNHNATCFKYGNKSKCRFGMPRDLVPTSHVDQFGVVHVKRSNGWVTSYNPAIASCIRSNHDITWIPTSSKALAYVYYLTNYATKADISPQQILVKGALIADSIKSAGGDIANTNDLQQDSKFLLRWYNSLAHDQEISGVQIANSLLQLPAHYTNFKKFVHFNLWRLRVTIRSLLNISNPNDIENDRYMLHPHAKTPINRFDNYRWRGSLLEDYSFWEYNMLVDHCAAKDASTTDCRYDPAHPKYEREVQRLAKTPGQVRTVSFHRYLSECQNEEESVRGGHPSTTAIQNDLAEALLGCFVPWQKIVTLFERHCADYQTRHDAYARVWSIVEPTLPAHLRMYARNFKLLQKSKEEMSIDRALRATEMKDTDDMEIVESISDPDFPDSETIVIDPDVHPETLISTCHNVVSAWHKDGVAASRQYAGLNVDWSPSYDLQDHNLSPLNILEQVSSESSGLRFVPDDTLQDWQSELKRTRGMNNADNADDTVTDLFNDFMDSAISDGNDDGLIPTLMPDDDIENLRQSRLFIEENPSASAVLDLVCQKLPLNRKQRLVAEKIISEAISWKDHPYDASKRNQMLMYIGGKAGTGKSRIVKAVIIALSLLQRHAEIVLMAPTGSAADNIDGNTYHTTLGMSINNKTTIHPAPRRIQHLWANKTIMIIDEISMTDLQSLSRINKRCNIARSLKSESAELFGEVPIVIFMGDFYQFPPVKGLPLWRQPRPNNEEEIAGQEIWHRFTDVILLDEQMRQAEDLHFQNFLHRVRNATLTVDDLEFLNSKVIPSVPNFPLYKMVSITKSNALRQRLTLLAMIQYARHHHQYIYLFPAQHGRLPPVQNLSLEDIFSQQDEGVKIPSQGLFIYTAGMPCMVLANVNSKLGLVNGSQGIATGVIIEPDGKIP